MDIDNANRGVSDGDHSPATFDEARRPFKDKDPLIPRAAKPSLSPSKKVLSPDGWLWEILAILGSLLCTGAVVFILTKMQEKPLKQWRAPISINTTVAILSTAMKMLVLMAVRSCVEQLKWIYYNKKPRPARHLGAFDGVAAASPWSALEMLYRVKWDLAYWAAAITLLFLAFDPFVQELVDIQEEPRIVEGDRSATFGFTHNYTFYDARTSSFTGFGPGGAAREVDLGFVDIGMQGAMLNGLFNLEMPSDVSCSANCTWDEPVISLGFTANCSDVTLETLGPRNCTVLHDPYDYHCRYETPGGVTLDTGHIPTFWVTALVVNSINTLDRVPGIKFFEDGQIPPEIVRIAIWRLKRDVYEMAHEPVEFLPGNYHEIVECSLRMAALKYTASNSTNNKFTSQVEEIPLNNGTRQRDAEGNYTGTIQYTGQDLPEMIVNRRDLMAIMDFLNNDPIVGNITIGDRRDWDLIGARAALLTGNLTEHIPRMARSMSEYSRRAGGSEVAVGTTWRHVAVVHVQWSFIVFPLAVQVACVVLLVATIWCSRPETLMWKENPMALFYMSYNEEDGTLKVPAEGLEDIDKKAKMGSGKGCEHCTCSDCRERSDGNETPGVY